MKKVSFLVLLLLMIIHYLDAKNIVVKCVDSEENTNLDSARIDVGRYFYYSNNLGYIKVRREIPIGSRVYLSRLAYFHQEFLWTDSFAKLDTLVIKFIHLSISPKIYQVGEDKSMVNHKKIISVKPNKPKKKPQDGQSAYYTAQTNEIFGLILKPKRPTFIHCVEVYLNSKTFTDFNLRFNPFFIGAPDTLNPKFEYKNPEHKRLKGWFRITLDSPLYVKDSISLTLQIRSKDVIMGIQPLNQVKDTLFNYHPIYWNANHPKWMNCKEVPFLRYKVSQ